MSSLIKELFTISEKDFLKKIIFWISIIIPIFFGITHPDIFFDCENSKICTTGTLIDVLLSMTGLKICTGTLVSVLLIMTGLIVMSKRTLKTISYASLLYDAISFLGILMSLYLVGMILFNCCIFYIYVGLLCILLGGDIILSNGKRKKVKTKN